MSGRGSVTNQQINSLIVETDDLPLYIYYDLSVRKAEIRAAASGSAQPILNKRAFGALGIDLPPPETQRAIALVLGALDDKIDLNRQINQTLEQIAQAIFKSWFVDFDPVKAKIAARAERRDPLRAAMGAISGKTDAELDQLPPESFEQLAATAALFPEKMEASELGEIPKGWEVEPLSTLVNIKGGKQLARSRFVQDGPCPVFGGAGLMGRTDVNNADGFVITVGRVGAYCGQFFWYRGPAWVNNNASHINPKKPADALWVYHWLKKADIEPIKKGAAQPFVSNGDIAGLEAATPAAPLRRHFAGLVTPLFEMLTIRSQENDLLAALRDTLLPKLLSGELPVPPGDDPK